MALGMTYEYALDEFLFEFMRVLFTFKCESRVLKFAQVRPDIHITSTYCNSSPHRKS